MAKPTTQLTTGSALTNLQMAMDCLALRKRGRSPAAISQQLGIPASTVRRYIEDAVTSLEGVKSEDAAHAREIELARLDDLYEVMHEKALRGDTRAVSACMHIMERRAKLAGLDKPSVVERHITISDVIPLENLSEAAKQYVARLHSIDAEVVEVTNDQD